MTPEVQNQSVESDVAAVQQAEIADTESEITASAEDDALTTVVEPQDSSEENVAQVEEENAPIHEDDVAKLAEDIKPETQAQEPTTRVSSLPIIGSNSDTSIQIGRSASALPTIGQQGSSSLDLQSRRTASVEQGVNAFETYSLSYVPTDQPILSIVFLDDGNLEEFDEIMPVSSNAFTFAMSGELSEAGRRSRKLRETGVEILVVAPQGTGQSLTEDIPSIDRVRLLQSYLDAIPFSIGLIDNPAALLQKDRAASADVLAVLEQTGHAIISYDGGLNSLTRSALRANIPVAEVFRQIDGQSMSAREASRQLDRAVIEANQSGKAIVLAHGNIETMRAIGSWLETGGAASVQLAPASVAIRAN